MVFGLIIFQIGVLLFLAIIHFNWVLGGTWGFDKALPTNEEGKRVLNPTRTDSAIVAVGLFLFTSYYLVLGEIITIGVPSWMLTYAGWAISFIFILRAIGDFNYIGFFKKVKETPFAKRDSKYYSPLCFILGVVGLLIEFL